jgi:DASS family divalent anion:Na+ symporter
VITWFSGHLKDLIVASGMGWEGSAALLVLVFVFSHYLFASTTAHVSAMMLAFLTVGVQLIPPDYVTPFMLVMVAGSTAMMALTHYATGTSPIIFGSGYVTMGKWWQVGFVMCVLQLVVYTIVGSLWWKLLGFW